MPSAWPSMLTGVFGVLLIAASVLTVLQLIRPDKSPATFTSIFQGGVRFNTYITLAVAQGLYGAEGLALGSMAVGFVIVIVNLACITVFAIWGKVSSTGPLAIVREVFYNPLIVACAIGWFLSLTGIGVPELADDVLKIISQAALPLGLLAVGAALKLKMIRGHAKPVFVSSAVQFILKPAVTALLIAQTGLTGIAAAVLFIAFMTPTSPSAYILARQLGGDTDSMASIITFQTLLAFIAMPVIAALVLG